MAVALSRADNEITAAPFPAPPAEAPSAPAPPQGVKKCTTFSTKCKASPVINILLLGKVGVGKARMVNEMFKKEIFKCGTPADVTQGVSDREKTFEYEGARYRAKIYDTVSSSSKMRGPRIKPSSTVAALRKHMAKIYPGGISAVFLVYRHGSLSNVERKRFLYILRRLNEETVPFVTALVITGCANKNESARKRIVAEFDGNPHTQEIGRYVLQGMYAVGFTDLGSVPDAMTEMYRVMNHRDAMVLLDVVSSGRKATQTIEVFFYRGRYYKGFCKFPWHYCPCYDQIYTCMRWGCSWEECLQVEGAEAI